MEVGKLYQLKHPPLYRIVQWDGTLNNIEEILLWCGGSYQPRIISIPTTTNGIIICRKENYIVYDIKRKVFSVYENTSGIEQTFTTYKIS